MESNGTSDEFTEILRKLTPEQLNFVEARIQSHSHAEAYRRIGINEGTFYSWPAEDRQQIDQAVQLARTDGVLMARERLRRMIPQALDALDDELASRRNPKRIDAIREVLDRAGVDVVQKHELRVRGNLTLTIEDLEQAKRLLDESTKPEG